MDRVGDLNKSIFKILYDHWVFTWKEGKSAINFIDPKFQH